MSRTRWQACVEPTCPHLRPRGGDCPDGHAAARRRQSQQATDRQRPPARERGYDRDHERNFRRPVLERDPVCVRCGQAPSEHADHHPLSRRQLVERGMNPNDPRHGRGLCHRCHSTVTASDDGGFGNPFINTTERH